jgi:hypothetical protein
LKLKIFVCRSEAISQRSLNGIGLLPGIKVIAALNPLAV